MSVLGGGFLLSAFQPFSAFGASVTLNPSDKSADITLSGGDLIAVSSQSDSNWDTARATAGKSVDCWYWEAKLTSATNNASFLIAGGGDASFTLTNHAGATAISTGVQNGASIFVSGGSLVSGITAPSLSVNDVLNFALDLTRGELYIGKNGTYFNSGSPSLRRNPTVTGISGTFYPAISIRGAGGGTVGGEQWTVNFGGSAFAQALPN